MVSRRQYAVIVPLEGLAGSHITDVAAGMISLAKRFGAPVSLDMNGARLLVFPNSTLWEVRQDYEAQLQSTQ